MVKRKAEVSIDEWLGGRTSIPVDSPTAAVPVEGNPTTSNDPTVEVTFPITAPEASTESVPAEPVTRPTAEVVVSVEDARHWFWTLLEEAVMTGGR